MELYEFASDYPEIFDMINEDVRYIISENNMNGDESLRDMDTIIENMINNYEEEEYNGYTMDDIPAQQIPYGGFRGRDDRIGRDGRGRGRRRRRHFRDFDIRDINSIINEKVVI